MTPLVWVLMAGIALAGCITLALSESTLKELLLPLLAMPARSALGWVALGFSRT
jgi:hypothetical protein